VAGPSLRSAGALAFVALAACNFESRRSAREYEGTRWTLAVRCGGNERFGVFQALRGSMHATSKFGCFEKAEQVASCKFCDPELDAQCLKEKEGSISELTQLSGDMAPAKALFVTLHGSKGGYAVIYLGPQDKPGAAQWRCEVPSLQTASDFEPCQRLGTFDANLDAWPTLGDPACRLALKSVQKS
jgi:hypothetical protein